MQVRAALTLDSNQAVALALKARHDLTDQAAVHAVGLHCGAGHHAQVGMHGQVGENDGACDWSGCQRALCYQCHVPVAE